MDPSHDPLPAVARICSAGEGAQPILPAGHVCVPLMRGGVGRGPRPYGRGAAAPRTQGIEKVPSGSAETLMPGQQQQAASSSQTRKLTAHGQTHQTFRSMATAAVVALPRAAWDQPGSRFLLYK
eukprot:COSAG01_NODE_1246_length_11073_cov_38.365683_2_plen_124_part_00